MGRIGLGGWNRWHEFGGSLLAVVCKQRRGQQSGLSQFFHNDAAAVIRTGTTCETSAILSGLVGGNCSKSSRSFSSKCGSSVTSGGVNIVSPSVHPQQQHFFAEGTFSSAYMRHSRNDNGSGNDLLEASNKILDLETSEVIPHFINSFSQRLESKSMRKNCYSGTIPIASNAGCPDGSERSSIDIADQALVYTMFPFCNNFFSLYFVRRGARGASTANAGNASCERVLPSNIALPSHLLGQSSIWATASLPAGEVVDWQPKRLGRLKDYDARYRHQPPLSSPYSGAEPDDIFIPVKAFYISRSVDLKSLAREPFLEVTTSRNNLIIRCADRPPHSPVTADNPEMACLGFLKERYMVVFQYGSVVFFNFGDLEEVESLDTIRKFCSDEFREARKDDYGVLVRPTLPEWSEGGHDRVMLRKLDIDNIRVISSILGQSIALDHYARKVDEMVTTFSELNRGMEQTGTFTMTRKSLFQLVAAANTTLADVILRLGLLERSDAAWKDANYAQIWEYLRDDFELDERFESLDFKLNIIQHNVRFFLEILQNRKSDTLEWIIILLITGEICVSLYDILHTAGAI